MIVVSSISWVDGDIMFISSSKLSLNGSTGQRAQHV